MMNESVTRSSKNSIDERLDCKSFPMFKLRQNFGSSSALKNDSDTSCHRLALSSPIDCKTSTSHFPHATEISSREFHFQREGISRNPGEHEKSRNFLESRSLAVARPSQENLTGSTPQTVPYRFNRGRTPESSFRSGAEGINQLSSILAPKEHFSNANFTVLKHEHCNYQSDSAFLVCEKTVDIQSKSGGCGTSFSFLRQNKASLSLHDPSTSNNNLPVCIGEQFQKMQNCSGFGFFPSRNSPPEAMESEKLYHGCYSLQRMPHSINDEKSTRIYTTVGSHTTRSLLITKTDVNMSKENQTFRESRVSTKLRGNTYTDFLSLAPLSAQGQGGVKLQYLGSSSNSEGKDNFEDLKNSEVLLKNESSTDTDTMDMDTFQENHLAGVNSSLPNKDINIAQNVKSQAAIASTSEEVGCRWPITGLPDINVELPALPAPANSTDNKEPSTSRTQSLDVEHLLSHAEQLGNSKTRPCADDPLRPDPISRWVKRLKLEVPHSFVLGTKCSNLGEGSSHEKVNKLFSKVMKGSATNSEPTLGKRHGKEPVALDQTAVLDSENKSRRDISLSHSWVQRWCHNQASSRQKKPEVLVVCEPQSSKLALDDVQTKQLPSIAAMALMGKTMSGFQPCEFQNRGSCVVWNTRSC